uniref:Uncharacterized protein n=2 Tax=Oryza punctata TaxID=4537 RepID=A0A0E0JTD6_ORYPU
MVGSRNLLNFRARAQCDHIMHQLHARVLHGYQMIIRAFGTTVYRCDSLFYLLCRDAHVLADARHRGSDEHGGGDLVREPLHGEREAEAAVAVPDEDQPLAGRSRGDGVEQRARVLLEGAHLVDARRVRARRGHVERRRAVPRGAQRGDHPVPAPRTVAEAVDQDEMLLAAAAADIHF